MFPCHLNSLVPPCHLVTTLLRPCYDLVGLIPVRSSVGYVTQDDIMYETLTPRENLTFAAAFILPKLSKESRSKEVDQLLDHHCMLACFLSLHICSGKRIRFRLFDISPCYLETNSSAAFQCVHPRLFRWEVTNQSTHEGLSASLTTHQTYHSKAK